MAAATFVLVADSGGFVGAFASVEEAQAALRPYGQIPLVFSAHPRADPGSRSLWILPYRGVDAVAYASDDRDAVVAAQAALLRVDLTYPDDVDFWEHEFGVVAAPARRRFESVLTALDAESDQKKLDAFDGVASGSREEPPPTRINLLETVVPRVFEPGRPPAAAPEASAEGPGGAPAPAISRPAAASPRDGGEEANPGDAPQRRTK